MKNTTGGYIKGRAGGGCKLPTSFCG